MLDSQFKIERPTRVYRQGLNLLHRSHGEDKTDGVCGMDAADVAHSHVQKNGSEKSSKIHSLKSGLSRIFHHPHALSTHSLPPPRLHHARVHSGSHGSSSEFVTSMGSDDEDENGDAGRSTPLVDPSTNMDPLRVETGSDDEMAPKQSKDGLAREGSRKKRKRAKDVSRHTFYVENSQMRLKLFARSTVSDEDHLRISTTRSCQCLACSVRCSSGLQPSSGLQLLRTG
jgi:phospholipase D1/2